MLKKVPPVLVEIVIVEEPNYEVLSICHRRLLNENYLFQRMLQATRY